MSDTMDQHRLHTYDFDAVPWSRGQWPGARLLAGVFIGPVGAGDDAAHTIHSVIAASWEKTGINTRAHTTVKTAVTCSLTGQREEQKGNTFFTVMFVLMQHKAAPALTTIAAKGVDTLMLTATVLLGALVFIWRGDDQKKPKKNTSIPSENQQH